MTPIDDESPIPLPLVWQTDVAPITLGGLAPALVDAGVVVRCQRRVACLDRGDGHVVWTHELPERSGYGATLARCGDVIVTDANHAGEPTTLVALGPDGAEAWRVTLDGRVPDGAVAVAGGRVYAVEHTSPGDDRLVAIDPRTGAVESLVELGLGLVAITAAGGHLIGRRHRVDPTDAGWIALPLDGAAPIAVASGPCVALAGSARGELMAAVMRREDGALALEVRHADTRELLWCRPVAAPACALDAGDVAAIVAGPDDPCPAVLDARTGVERHRGEPFEDGAKVETLALVGPLVFVDAPAGQRIDRRADGVSLGECFTHGPPAVDSGRVYFGADDGAVCGALD